MVSSHPSCRINHIGAPIIYLSVVRGLGEHLLARPMPHVPTPGPRPIQLDQMYRYLIRAHSVCCALIVGEGVRTDEFLDAAGAFVRWLHFARIGWRAGWAVVSRACYSVFAASS